MPCRASKRGDFTLCTGFLYDCVSTIYDNKMNIKNILMFVGAVAAVGLVGYGIYRASSRSGSTAANPEAEKATASVASTSSHRVTLQTNFGEIQLATYDVDAPKTVENFLKLAGQGFYNNVT